MKLKGLISLIIVFAMMVSCLSVPCVSVQAQEAERSLEDYPDEEYLMDANNKKSIEASGLKASKTNTNENEYAGEWCFSEVTAISFTEVKDICGFGKLEFYLYGDEKYPAKIKLVLGADDPETDKWDYYDGGGITVKPGWNKYSYDLAAIQKRKINSPKPFYDIDGISLYASGWNLEKTNDMDNTVLCLDSVKLIKGEKVLIEVIHPETEAGTSKYFDLDFEVEKLSDIPGGASFVAKMNKMDIAREKNGNRYLEIEDTDSGSDCHFDVTIKNATRYSVISMDYKYDVAGAGQLITLKDNENKQEKAVLFKADGSVHASGQVAAPKPGEWVNVAMCLDVLNHVYDIYVNGKLVKENIAMSNAEFTNTLKVVRVYLAAGSKGRIGIDNFRVFDGKSPEDYEKAVNPPATNVVQEEIRKIDVNSDEIPDFLQVKSDAVEEVKNAVCLKLNVPYALVRHEQKAIDANNKEVAPFVINGRTLVPVRFIAEAFGAEVGWDAVSRTVTVKKDNDILTLAIGLDVLNKNGTEIKIDVPAEIYNDRTMLPLRAVTENLGKKVFWDDMGLIIISDDEISFTKEKDLHKMLDIMAGICYERPGREQIKADIIKKSVNHPRILATEADFERIKSLMTYDSNVRAWVADVIAQADDYVQKAKTDAAPVYDGGGENATGRASDYDLPDKAPVLAMAYRVTGDVKYVDALWATLGPMCEWEHWHPGHFLNAAEMMLGAAIAYDWLYDVWTPEQRVIIEESLYDKGIEDSLGAYYGANDYLAPPMGIWHRSGWWKAESNWNAVCNAGVTFAGLALATHEKYGDLAVKAVEFAMSSFEVGIRCYAPDGGYVEGPGYWVYGTNHAVFLMAALTSATGTSYGLSDAPGFNIAYATPVYSESKLGMFNYSDSADSKIVTDSFMWFAKEYNDASIGAIRANEINTGEKAISWKDVLWYNPTDTQKGISLAPDSKFYVLDTATFRSSWTDKNQIFTGLHGGSNNVNHCQIDTGTFVLDALGSRWFLDLGSDNYNLPDYWSSGAGGKRWTYYTMRAEGHNTYVINPGLSEEQAVNSRAKIIEFVSKPRGGYSKLDMSSTYANGATSAVRGLMLTENRKAVVLQDEIVMRKPSEFYWFAHTKADIQISEDKRSAVLVMDGKKLHCRIVSEDVNLKFSVMDAQPLPTSPVGAETDTQKQYSREGIRKLVIYGSGVEKINLAVVFVPLIGDGEPEYSYTYTKMDNWSIPDGNIIAPKLEAINVDGALIEGFDSDKTAYEIILPYRETRIPEIGAVADLMSTCYVTMPDSLPGVATIKVVNNEDASMYSIYSVTVKNRKETEIEVSGEQEGNERYNCMDKNLGTRWAVAGESWGIFDFAEPKTVSSVWIATWKAAERKLIFDIEVSEDGVNFTQVWSGQSAANTDTLEEFKIPEGTYKAVKLVLHGTTTGSWNSILEVEFK